MSTWFEPDDEIARRLEQTLRQEADAMSIPENFDQVADAARAERRQRTTGTIAGSPPASPSSPSVAASS